MTRQYPIWNKVQACIYKGNKSYGVIERGEVDIFVGSSSSNSHFFLSHCITHKKHDNGDRTYYFKINNEVIKKAILKKNSNELEYI